MKAKSLGIAALASLLLVGTAFAYNNGGGCSNHHNQMQDSSMNQQLD